MYHTPEERPEKRSSERERQCQRQCERSLTGSRFIRNHQNHHRD
jgi:hypothetical protein